MFKARLKYKKSFIDGYFIDLNGNIYDHNGVKQETYISDGYQMFKRYKVHQLMCHSFYGYKPGFDIHHKNQIKTDNRLQNLVYLPRAEHRRLHIIDNNPHPKKKVICLETGIEYESISAASKEFNIQSGHLSRHLNKKQGHKSVGGLHFQFVCNK